MVVDKRQEGYSNSKNVSVTLIKQGVARRKADTDFSKTDTVSRSKDVSRDT